MKSLSLLKKELSTLRQKARTAQWNDPRIRAAQAEVSRLRGVIDREYSEPIKSLEAEITSRSKAPRPKPILPPEALDFLNRLSRCFAEGEKMTLEPLHGPFYIWHSPGGTWSDNGGQHYGAATHKVIDLRKEDKRAGAMGAAGTGTELPEVSGRLSKAQRDEWLAWAIKQN